MNYATRGARFIAAVIDILIVVAVAILVGMVLGTLQLNNSFVNLVFQLALGYGYYAFYQAQSGQTLGKKAMGIKIVNLSGKKPDVNTFLFRETLVLVPGILIQLGFITSIFSTVGSLLSLVVLFGYAMILWDGKRQGLHDKIVKTFVVKA